MTKMHDRWLFTTPKVLRRREKIEMPKKSYALRNRRGYMDSTFEEGLRIVLQWMELRRRHAQFLLQRELYMLRSQWNALQPHSDYSILTLNVLPGGNLDSIQTIRRRLEKQGQSLQGLRFYAPGY